MPGTLDLRLKPKPACDACRREVDGLRGSMWHRQARICRECFYEWYDGHGSTDPVVIGNYVRARHGLEPLPAVSSPSERGNGS